MKIYLDTSALNRPFDDQSQPKIFLETQAVSLILQAIRNGKLRLVNSAALEYENNRNSNPERQATVGHYLQMASLVQLVDEMIFQRATNLESRGLKPLDALHLVCAERAGCDYFITCDKRLLNRYQSEQILAINPIHFVLEE
ncbi:MAG: PIN domain-containing protein [Prochlorotrichaceae cyanobacterium]|jgi:predicted nucleic acid-binding protein